MAQCSCMSDAENSNPTADGRFIRRYHRQRENAPDRGVPKRLAIAGLGIVVTIIGIILQPLPGPGTAIAIFGLLILAGESRRTASMLDWGERRLQPLIDRARKIVDSIVPPTDGTATEKQLGRWRLLSAFAGIFTAVWVVCVDLVAIKYAPTGSATAISAWISMLTTPLVIAMVYTRKGRRTGFVTSVSIIAVVPAITIGVAFGTGLITFSDLL